MKAYQVKIKGDDWQVIAISDNARDAKNMGYKAIKDIDPQADYKYTDIRVKLLTTLGSNWLLPYVYTSCGYITEFCKYWRYDIEMCNDCGLLTIKKEGEIE